MAKQPGIAVHRAWMRAQPAERVTELVSFLRDCRAGLRGTTGMHDAALHIIAIARGELIRRAKQRTEPMPIYHILTGQQQFEEREPYPGEQVDDCPLCAALGAPKRKVAIPLVKTAPDGTLVRDGHLMVSPTAAKKIYATVKVVRAEEQAKLLDPKPVKPNAWDAFVDDEGIGKYIGHQAKSDKGSNE